MIVQNSDYVNKTMLGKALQCNYRRADLIFKKLLSLNCISEEKLGKKGEKKSRSFFHNFLRVLINFLL